MNFEVNNSLRIAVDNFPWVDHTNDHSFSVSETDSAPVIAEIKQNIKAASDIKSVLPSELSLIDICNIITQDLDKKYGGPTTLDFIEKAAESIHEKNILTHLFKKLSLDDQQPQNDLKAMTLLFGVKKISQLAKQKLTPSQPIILDPASLQMLLQRQEMVLKQLIALNSKFAEVDMNQLPEANLLFLQKVDTQIQASQAQITALKLSLEHAVL